MTWYVRTAALLAATTVACSPGGKTSGTGRDADASKSPPCYPGCFPAGTPVVTPNGSRPIDALKVGDEITLIGPNGNAVSGVVQAVFKTTNHLLEVRTEAGTLLTTDTQPLARVSGGFRPAGELTPGDLVWRWEGDRRQPTLVTAVVATGREESVFNLVAGEGAAFVAGGYVVRGKPPAENGGAGRGE